ncbi:RyR domain-containing protein [uncultured Methanobrevibacter sp.]|uniref:RyR domain-containing protein n=1 Tax=uncultured Methanobrevibacter sp. TaxID=253161 RepID=UPI00261D02B9|nr:RyR domain-containing protein [uncultured Methanobrevibacter sp.]
MSDDNFKKYIDDFFNDLELYDDINNGHKYKDLLQAVVYAFLENENSYNAYEVYETFFMIYQITAENKSDPDKQAESFISNEPNSLLELVKIMRKYENSTGDLIEKQRDHFIHSVNVFLLGLAIYSQNSQYRRIFKDYIEESPYQKYYRFEDEKGKVIEVSNEEFLYRWGIASLFHDIGYPVEIIGKQLKQFINEGVQSISRSYKVQTGIDFKNFNEFNSIRKIKPEFADRYREEYPESKFLDLFKPTNIMAHKISNDLEVDLNMLLNHLDNFVDYMGNNGFIDHGFFSSILVLNSYGSLIQAIPKKDQDFFFYPIVDSASAILLHNYYRNILQKAPFELDQLACSDSPLAFLLILCDELQEWNRRPLGIKDKQKNHVNDLLIDIDNEKMIVKYVVKSGSLGFGFSKDKVSFLNDVLFIEDIFDIFFIKTKIELGDVIRKIERRDVQAPYVLMSNIELLAAQVHQNYVNEEKKKGRLVRETYDDLSPEFKLSNIRQAKSIPTKLNMIGCEMALLDDPRPEYTFSKDEIINLAMYEHERWCEEKLENGWIYKSKRNNELKHHPSLRDWKKLPKAEKQKDIDSIENIPAILKSIGLKVVDSKLKLLTHEKHKYYSDKVKAKEFDELSQDIRFSNYKQTTLLVKTLGDLGYKLVSVEEDGEEVTELSQKEATYLARREHESWYLDNINFGWKYGSRKNKTKKTNPNLVSWDDLNNKVKKLNIRTLKHLPTLCNNVGLKIIKLE